MRFPIGQMSIGDLFDRSLKLFLARWPTFYLINLVIYLPLFVFQSLMPLIVYRSVIPAEQQAVLLMLSALVMLVLTFVLQPIGIGASLYVVANEFVDREVTVLQAFGFALARFWSLLGAVVLMGLVVAAPIILGLIPGVLVVPLSPVAGILVIMLGMLAGLVVALALYIRFAVFAQVVVVEASPALASFPRAAALSAGFRWRILGVYALLLVIGMVLGVVAQVLQQVLPFMETQGTFPNLVQTFTSYTNYLINQVAQFLMQIVVNAYSAVCWTLLYFDLRIRKEAFDLELAAQGRLGPATTFRPLADATPTSVPGASEPLPGDRS